MKSLKFYHYTWILDTSDWLTQLSKGLSNQSDAFRLQSNYNYVCEKTEKYDFMTYTRFRLETCLKIHELYFSNQNVIHLRQGRVLLLLLSLAQLKIREFFQLLRFSLLDYTQSYYKHFSIDDYTILLRLTHIFVCLCWWFFLWFVIHNIWNFNSFVDIYKLGCISAKCFWNDDYWLHFLKLKLKSQQVF